MIKMIVAVDDNYGIGYNNELLFRVREDLERFKNLTLGKDIVMGRKTYESLPKVLPYRHYIVITRSPDYITLPSIISDVYTNINEVVRQFSTNPYEDVWVIGGAEIYKQFLPFAKEIHITHIHKFANKVDTYFPYMEMMNEGFKIYELRDFYSKEEGCKVAFAIYRKSS